MQLYYLQIIFDNLSSIIITTIDKSFKLTIQNEILIFVIIFLILLSLVIFFMYIVHKEKKEVRFFF